MTATAIDNDVLLKGACYGLLLEMVSTIPSHPSQIGVLGAAQFVVIKNLNKKNYCSSPEEAKNYLMGFIGEVSILEPNADELAFAAELEHMAQRAGVSLDGGESQLTAMVIVRNFDCFVTGDKRAIAALGYLRENDQHLKKMDGKVLCLEQIIERLLSSSIDPITVRDAICNEPNVDKAVTICFSCKNKELQPDQWMVGLNSYIADTRNKAKTLLAA